MSDADYDSIFTTGQHAILAFHGYPTLIRPDRDHLVQVAIDRLPQLGASGD